MKIIDTHAHYCDSWFTAPETPEQPYEEILDGLLGPDGELGAIVNVATTPDNAPICIEQAARWPGMYAAIGIHPCDCQLYDDPVAELARLRPWLNEAKKHKVVALGENCGSIASIVLFLRLCILFKSPLAANLAAVCDGGYLNIGALAVKNVSVMLRADVADSDNT